MNRVPVRVPDLGAGPVRFGLWLVEPGEAVYAGDRLAEILVPAASVDVAAPATGIFLDPQALPRDALQPGQVVGFIAAEDDED
ncbi:MAG: hypothetical protein U0840_11805 [Gemmataceae bacterium]